MKHKFFLSDGPEKIEIDAEIPDGSDMERVLGLFLAYPGKPFTVKEIVEVLKFADRHVWQLIRELRLRKVPIIPSDEGLYITEKLEDILKFADYLEGRGKKNVISYMKLRREVLGIVNRFRPSLFDEVVSRAEKEDLAAVKGETMHVEASGQIGLFGRFFPRGR